MRKQLQKRHKTRVHLVHNIPEWSRMTLGLYSWKSNYQVLENKHATSALLFFVCTKIWWSKRYNKTRDNNYIGSYYFYRAMHVSAKRGLAIACRLSVRLWCWYGLWSHCWNSSEIISQLVSLGCSLSVDLNIRGLFQGKHPEILAESDPPPVDFELRRHSIANCGRMVTDSATVTLESL